MASGQGRSKIKVKKGSKRYLKTIVTAVMAWMRTKRDIEKEKMDKRNIVVADLEEGLKLYTEIAKGWLVKGIKHPLISMIKDSDLNLNFLVNP